jgi:hypothetical protein
MGARRRFARIQTRQIARDRLSDPDESALHQIGGWRMITKAIRNHRARKAERQQERAQGGAADA